MQAIAVQTSDADSPVHESMSTGPYACLEEFELAAFRAPVGSYMKPGASMG